MHQSTNHHPLLGSHKPSQEWYTPQYIWDKVSASFDYPIYYITDPCPIGGLPHRDILSEDWQHIGLYVYCNPPTPAAPWAKKCIEAYRQNPKMNIIFAAFSEAVLWQVNDLMDYPVCWVRNRIPWIDGNRYKKDVLNPNYMKPAKSPRNYNAFILLSNDDAIRDRFVKNFSDLGTIRQSKSVSST